MAEEIDIVEGERCPYCLKKTLTLMERVIDIPHFGLTHVFSMECQDPECGYHMSDVESDENRKPMKETFEVSSEDDLRVRVVKSSAATVKIPRMVEITPGPDSNGYVTNVEGVLNRFKKVLEELTHDDDKAAAKKAKNQLKKLQRVLWGRESVKIILEDPSGNSAFIREPGSPN